MPRLPLAPTSNPCVSPRFPLGCTERRHLAQEKFNFKSIKYPSAEPLQKGGVGSLTAISLLFPFRAPGQPPAPGRGPGASVLSPRRDNEQGTVGASRPCGSPRGCGSGRSLLLRAESSSDGACSWRDPRHRLPRPAKQPHERRKPPATGRGEDRLF